ncbi:hypothetical protein NDN08_001956 [Rhodosorus marinus]|uniref:Uncharacterized protein n=1 Tax=Rhodosorus marinus TaxID=101924 RepID=A0AAV8USA7_9RHOD|nr:hypothetical protein NDN08_001956 [Rhodosorus marinus]
MVHFKVSILFVLFIVCIGISSLADARSTSKTSPIARSLKRQQRRCEKSSACYGLHDEHLHNCILKCASEHCYELIYAKDPLEDGEVDNSRSKAFLKCFDKSSRGESVSPQVLDEL